MKKTIIKDLHVDLETGVIHVLLHKRVLDDSGQVLAQGNHRTVIDPGTDLDATIRAINEHLVSGQVPVSAEASGHAAAPVDVKEWDAVRAHARVVHTPAIKTRWKVQQDAKRAEELTRQRLAEEANAKAQAQADARFKAAVAEAVKAQST